MKSFVVEKTQRQPKKESNTKISKINASQTASKSFLPQIKKGETNGKSGENAVKSMRMIKEQQEYVKINIWEGIKSNTLKDRQVMIGLKIRKSVQRGKVYQILSMPLH